MSIPFWQEDADAPFATLLGVIAGACHPEAWEDAYEDLKRIVREHPDTPQMVRFKQELRTAIREPSRIPRTELSEAAQYPDGSAEQFLARLWSELYRDESMPTPPGRGG